MGGAQGAVRRREARVLMVGLEDSGKSTLLYRLILGELVSPIPTIGFNQEELDYKNFHFTIWFVLPTLMFHISVDTLSRDAGGKRKIRPLWR